MTKNKSDSKADAKPKDAADAGNPDKVDDILRWYNKGLKKVPANRAFITKDGQRIYSLLELAHALEDMLPETFVYHTRRKPNDFYNWINDSIKDNELAESIVEDHISYDMAAHVARRIAEYAKGPAEKPRANWLSPSDSGLKDSLSVQLDRFFGVSSSSLPEEMDIERELNNIISRCDIEEASKRHRMLEGIKPVLLSNPHKGVMEFITNLDRLKSEDPKSYKLFDEFYSTVESVATRGIRGLIANLNKSESRLDDLSAKLPEIFEAARKNPECYGHEFRDSDGKTINIFANRKMYDDPVYQKFCDQFRKIAKQIRKEKVDAARLAAEEAKNKSDKKHSMDTFYAVYSTLVIPFSVGFGGVSVALWADYLTSVPEKIAAFSIPAVAGGIVVGSLPYLAKKAYRTVFGSDKYNPEKIFKPRIGPGYTRINLK